MTPDRHPPTVPLPPDLDRFLAEQAYALLTAETTDGTILIAKLPDHEIESLRGQLPIRSRFELFRHPAGPVLRLTLTFFDRPGSHLTLETFCNVDDPTQLREWADLLCQPALRVAIFGELRRQRLGKRVGLPPDLGRQELIPTALRLLAAIAPDERDFDQARAAVIADNPLDRGWWE